MLSITSLRKTYPDDEGRVTAVESFDLVVAPGEWVTLLGPSGCGKTTTLRCVAGLETPDSGEIRIGEETVFSGERNILRPPNRRPISMVFQSYAIWPHMTVRQNVAFPVDGGRGQRDDANAQVLRALEMVGIAHLADRDATRLSGGQQQRVALARAIVQGAGLMLLDEPLSNLDAQLRQDMRAELRRLREQLATTTLHVTHDQEEALSLADRIVLLRLGRVVEIGDPRQLYLRPERAFTAQFLGHAELWDTTSVVRDGETTRVMTELGSIVTRDDRPDREGPAQLMIRPEHIDVVDAHGTSPSHNTVEGVVRSTMFIGKRLECTVDVGGRLVRIDRPATAVHGVGDQIRLWFPPDYCVVVTTDRADAVDAGESVVVAS